MVRVKFPGGNNQYYLDVDAALSSQDYGRNVSVIYHRTFVDKTSGNGYSGSGNGSHWIKEWPSGYVRCQGGGYNWSFVGTSRVWYCESTFDVYHDGNGNASYNVEASVTLGYDPGNAYGQVGNINLPRIPQVPGAPGTPVASNITPTSATLTWTGASRGHADIDLYRLYTATDAGFTTGVQMTDQNNLSRTHAGLLPGTKYWVRVYAHNGDGFGAGTDSTFTTLPSSPAVLTSVTPDATGKQAVVVMAPPPGISTVNSYKVENRNAGGTWATVASGSANPSQTITGLTPGQTYEWRASAVIGTYTSPPSAVITRTQPQPNASPGAYFDGDTPDGSTVYGWTGTAGASKSTATTQTGGAVGWISGANAVNVSGGSAVQYQVQGGLEPAGNSGAWAVRYAMLTPATGDLFRGGTDGLEGHAVVTVGGVYMGSIWVQSSKARALAARIYWRDAAGAAIAGGTAVATVVGTSVNVEANVPTRLTVIGTAPGGAARMSVEFVTPVGSTRMDAGDIIDADAAMASVGVLYPYFDGDTPDSEQYIYQWEPTQYTSPSSRETIPQSARNPLQDPNCDPLPQPPTAPIIEDDCITPIGSWRRTWYSVGAQDVPDYLAAAPTVILTTYSEAEPQVRIRWYQNPDCTDALSFDSSEWDFEQIVSYIPPNTTITLDGVSRRVWAESPTGSTPIPADSLLYGTGGVPATWPTITCAGCWLVSLDTDLKSTVGNLVVDARLTIRE